VQVCCVCAFAGLEIAVCHLPFSEQNMNMAHQNQDGSATWPTNASLHCHGSVLKIPLIIIIIFSYLNWVAISQRLLLKHPVSHTLAHTHNHIKSN
jgi:hypothetical protein